MAGAFENLAEMAADLAATPVMTNRARKSFPMVPSVAQVEATRFDELGISDDWGYFVDYAD